MACATGYQLDVGTHVHAQGGQREDAPSGGEQDPAVCDAPASASPSSDSSRQRKKQKNQSEIKKEN